MSKDITIKEGSLAKEFGTVKKIRVNNIGGGTSDWVPEDEVQLTTLRVNENGEYVAADEGYYGYDRVIVNGIGSASGYGDEGDTIGGVDLGDGNEHYVDEDGDGGFTAGTHPSSIALIQAPQVTTYSIGQTISLQGAKIQAYTALGEVWEDANHPSGAIKLSEVTWSPTVVGNGSSTHITNGEEFGGGSLGGFDGYGGSLPIVRAADTYLGRAGSREFYKQNNEPAYVWFDTEGTCGPELLSTSRDAVLTNQGSSIDSVVVNGVTWYLNYGYHMSASYDTAGFPDLGEGWIDHDNINDMTFEEFFAKYGIDSSFQNKLKVMVRWNRPVDGKTLETSFYVIVIDSNS